MKKILIISATSGNNLILANKVGKLIELENEIISNINNLNEDENNNQDYHAVIDISDNTV